MDDKGVFLDDGTVILCPDQDGVIRRASQNDVLWYVEIRCPGDRDYSEWAALFEED